MTLQECQNVLAMIEYRDFQFVLRSAVNNYLVELYIKRLVPDVRDPKKIDYVYVPLNFNPDVFKTEMQFVHFVFSGVREAEIHEAKEWFKFRGERIFDPHREKAEVA